LNTLVVLNGTIVDQHGITREYIANQSNYTNQLVMYAAGVANSSVDRNNSLLYNMMHYLLIKAGYPITGNVTAIFIGASPEIPYYWDDWTITAGAKDEYNRTISYPDVECFLTSNMGPRFRMTPVGTDFVGTVFINVLVDDITVEVDCNRIIY